MVKWILTSIIVIDLFNYHEWRVSRLQVKNEKITSSSIIDRYSLITVKFNSTVKQWVKRKFKRDQQSWLTNLSNGSLFIISAKSTLLIPIIWFWISLIEFFWMDLMIIICCRYMKWSNHSKNFFKKINNIYLYIDLWFDRKSFYDHFYV